MAIEHKDVSEAFQSYKSHDPRFLYHLNPMQYISDSWLGPQEAQDNEIAEGS